MWDMDVPIEITNDTNEDGVDFVRITPNSAKGDDGDSSYDICLNKDQLEEFIDALRFIGRRL